MRRAAWLRLWPRTRSPWEVLSSLADMISAGAPLGEVVRVASESLISLARASRAGVWMDQGTPGILCGAVVEATSGSLPGEWNRLDVSAPVWDEFLGSPRPVVVDLRSSPRQAVEEESPDRLLGLLAGAEEAVWWPVHSRGRTFGLAMLSWSMWRGELPDAEWEPLRAVTELLAFAVDAHSARESFRKLSSEALEREIRLREVAEKAISSGARAAQELAAAQRALLQVRSSSHPGCAVDNAEEQLACELHAVLDSVESGILLFDASGRLRYFNDRVVSLLGLDATFVQSLREAHTTAGVFDLMIPVITKDLRNPEEFALRWRERVLSGDEAASDALEFLHPVHRTVMRFSRPILGTHGERLGWLEVYRDTASLRPSPAVLLQTEKMAALGQLLCGVTHELNNPLTSILGYAQLALARSASATLAPRSRGTRHVASSGPTLRDVEHIHAEAERAVRIIKDLLHFAYEGPGERSLVDLNGIIEHTLSLRGYELKLGNIEVELDLETSLAPVRADSHQLQQVVLNLLVNAEQAILHAPGRSSSAAPGRICIRSFTVPDLQPPRVALEISDTGPGIPQDVAPRVFDPFFTTKPAGVGTGLGLSIAAGIIRDHDGELYLAPKGSTASARNAPFTGATFVAELPAAEPQQVSTTASHGQSEADLGPSTKGDTQRQRAVSSPAAADASSQQQLRVLVVEDEPTVAELIADVLRQEHFEVEIVLDSGKGLRMVLTQHFDLIICDLRMPRLDGTSFYRFLANAGHPAHRRMIFVTGDTLSRPTLEFLKTSRLPFLAKPFLVEELKEVIYRALNESAPQAGAKERRPEARRAQNRLSKAAAGSLAAASSSKKLPEENQRS